VLLAAAEAALGGREPMEEIPARQLAALPRPGVDAAVLFAERAEALAQLAAAEASLAGLDRPPVSSAADAELLRRVAREALAAEAAVQAIRSRVTQPASPPEVTTAVGVAAETLLGDLSVARRRMAGAVISSCGMSIVVAAAGWSPLWHAAPVMLVSLFAADLRAASRAARLATEPEPELDHRPAAADEVADGEALRAAEEIAARALARWGALAPEGPPAEVESIIARRLENRPETAPVAIVVVESNEADPDRRMAARLVEEARADLARAEKALQDLAGWLGLGPLDPIDIPAAVRRALDGAEHARRSLAWHEARRAVEAVGAG
jgi:hypothetical protein